MSSVFHALEWLCYSIPENASARVEVMSALDASQKDLDLGLPGIPIQWVRLCTLNAEGPGLILSRGTRCT